MGFRPPLTTINLDWPEGHRLHGLVIKISSVTVDEYNEIQRLMYSVHDGAPQKEGETAADATARVQAAIQAGQKDSSDLLDMFAEALIEWNYEDPKTGEPLPPDRAGVGRADAQFLTHMIFGWTGALVSVPDPLPNGSPNGRTASDMAESTLGLATVSTSHPS